MPDQLPNMDDVGTSEDGTRSSLYSSPEDGLRGAASIPRAAPTALDVCCGSRMFWFDPQDERALFMDKRREAHVLTDNTRAPGSRVLNVDPDLQADFTALPFADNTFPLVVFDPPHLIRAGKGGWLAKKYGVLGADWKDELRAGFAECFRVLQPHGTLVFKWNEYQVPVAQVLALTPVRPLFGNRSGKASKSHWIVFQKTALQGARDRDAEGLRPKDRANSEPVAARADEGGIAQTNT